MTTLDGDAERERHDLLEGTLVAGRYQVSDRLGAGGMAVVYRALDTVSGVAVALKVMADSLLDDAEAQRRFKAEQRVMAALDHPGIPSVHDLGLTAAGLPFFAMELVSGSNLEDRGALPADTVREILGELLPILGHLHRRGLVHGDLKADNVMSTEHGRLKLMDFGLAGPAGARPRGLEGTVTHVAPELIQRGKADQRSDLYAVGVIVYKLLTGKLPLEGPTAAETLKMQVETSPLSPKRLVTDLSADLDSLTMRLLSKRPQDRPQSANEVLRALGLPADEDDTLAIPLQGPFVGRTDLLGDLLDAVGFTAQGHRPKPLMLLGEPGMGKSRVLEELGAQARLMDLPVAIGQCPPTPTPFGPWIDLSRDLLALGRSLAPEQARALSAALTPLTGGESSSAQDAPQALRFALAQLIGALANGRGLVLALDDWERADPASTALLTQLIGQEECWPVLWLTTALAPGETPGGDAHVSQWEIKVLGPLNAVEMALLVASNLGATEVPAVVTNQIQESSRGNPRFAEDLLRFLLANKRLVHRQSGWALVAGSDGDLPTGLQALYSARLAQVSPNGRQLARTLAVSGGALALDVAAHASGLAPDPTEEAAVELVARQLAIQSAEGVALLDHQLAGWLLKELNEEQCETIHGALADALARNANEHPPLRVLNALAHHGMLGPNPAGSLRWLMEAARQNLAVKALAEARRFALAAHRFSTDLPNEERIEILEVLATAHRGLDEADAALAIAEEAVSLAETLESAELLARSLNGLGKIHQLASRYEQAKEAFERAASAAADTVPLELTRSHRALARLAFFAGDMDTAYNHGRQALRLARRHASPAERAQVLAEIGETFQGEESRLQEGLACLEEAQSIARELSNSHLESLTAAGLGNLQLALGQLAGARGSFQRAADLFEGMGNSGEALFARLNLALVAEEQGHFATAESLAATVASESRKLNRKFPLAAAMTVEGSAQVHQGHTVEGLKRLAEAAEVAEEINHKYVRAIIRQVEGPVRLLLGHWSEAQEQATRLAEFAEAAGAPELGLRAKLISAEILLHTGNPAHVAPMLEPVLQGPHAALRLRAQILRAAAALKLHDEATTFQALHAARSLLPEVDAPRQEAELLLLEAAVEDAESDRSGVLAGAAVALLEQTDQRHLLVQGLGALAAYGPPRGRKAAAARAKELVTSLASALGDDGFRYLAAHGRGALAEDVAAAPLELGAVPSSFLGLKELVKRLEQGLTLLESQGSGGGGDARLIQRRLEQVVSFANAVNSTLKLATVIDRALALVIEVAGAERGLLLLKEGGNLASQRYQTAPGFEDEGSGGEQYSRTVARAVLETGETICVLDALADQRFAQQASVMGLNLQTILCVPLKDQNEVVGAIYVDRQGLSDQFNSGDLDIVQALASLTAQAIINAKLMRAQEDRQVHLEMLNRLSRTLSRTLELEKVLDLIADITIEVTKAERTFILLWENEQLVFGAGRDTDGPLPPQAGREISRSICQKVVDTQQGVFLMDTGSDVEFATKMSVVNLKLNSVVAVPLIGQAGITGVLYVDSRNRVTHALEKEVAVLTAIANTASLAVDNARLYRQATVDGLTTLYVRSFFLMRLDEEIRRTRRFGGKFSLLVMDIDHFKRFNDSYGHAVGDTVLKLVSKTIKDCVRVGLDLPCRYGGEEMVVLLPETDTPGALVTAERIRREIENASLPGAEGESMRVTISIGVATFPIMAESASELFERADQALYASKHGGRNRTTVYEVEEVASSETGSPLEPTNSTP